MSDFGTAWPLYSELHAICKELDVHTSVAANLAGVLTVFGCEHVGDICGIPLECIAHHYGIGPKALMVAESFGAKVVER